MAKLSGANLPDWLAQWAMNRGAIEDPSTSAPSASSSGLFDQPVIRRRRPPEGDNWNEYEPSPVLDSYPTSWADFRRDMGNIPGQLWKDISNIPESLGELATGASSMYNDAGRSVKEDTEEKTTGLLGRTDPDSFFRRTLSGGLQHALTDPKSSLGERAGALLGMGVSAAMPFPLTAGLGLFGGILNSMGAYHDYDKSKDTDLSFDPDSGELSWGGIGSHAQGGGQYGSLNNMNMINDIAERFPDEYISTPLGYTTAGNLKDALGSGMFQNFDDYTNFGDSGFRQDTPFGWQPFGGQGDHNVTNQHALAQYRDSGIGAIQNEAGAIADRLGVGYNEQQVIADRLAGHTRAGVDINTMRDDGVWKGPDFTDDSFTDESGIFGGIDTDPSGGIGDEGTYW